MKCCASSASSASFKPLNRMKTFNQSQERKINQPRPHNKKESTRQSPSMNCDLTQPLPSAPSPAPLRRTARRGPRASATRPASPPTTSSRCRASSASGTSSSASPTAPSPTRCTAPPLTSPPPRPWPTGRRYHPGTRAKVRLTCSVNSALRRGCLGIVVTAVF